MNFKIFKYRQLFTQDSEQAKNNMEVSNLFFSRCNINQCLKVLVCLQYSNGNQNSFSIQKSLYVWVGNLYLQ